MAPTEFLTVDQGSNHVSKDFREKTEAAGVTFEEAPIETPVSIGTVERYHALLRCSFDELRSTLDKGDSTDAECLQMAVYAANATMGSMGLCPMLLVYKAHSRPLMHITLSAVASKVYREIPEICYLGAGEKAHQIFLSPPRRDEGERKIKTAWESPSRTSRAYIQD